MTYPAGTQKSDRAQLDEGGQPQALPVQQRVTADLTDQQKRVLDCLQSTSSGLTLAQMANALSSSPEQVRAAVDDLVGRDLVGELNTIIPSYLPRYPGIRVYAD